MKKLWVPIIIGVVFMMAPMMATAASLTGSVQGLACVTQGKVCPVGMEDPVIAAENVFVLLVDASKGEYYFVPNVDRGIMARHINEQVKIDGTVNEKMKSIKASDIYAMNMRNQWQKVWSVNMQDSIYKDIYGSSVFGN
ncbi:MAG: hypothetical protein LLG97_13375 [Deltaproteobacteria bacterium]|nr:hypothetical protein [Deltaproteobacteria bacterium]